MSGAWGSDRFGRGSVRGGGLWAVPGTLSLDLASCDGRASPFHPRPSPVAQRSWLRAELRPYHVKDRIMAQHGKCRAAGIVIADAAGPHQTTRSAASPILGRHPAVAPSAPTSSNTTRHFIENSRLPRPGCPIATRRSGRSQHRTMLIRRPRPRARARAASPRGDRRAAGPRPRRHPMSLDRHHSQWRVAARHGSLRRSPLVARHR